MAVHDVVYFVYDVHLLFGVVIHEFLQRVRVMLLRTIGYSHLHLPFLLPQLKVGPIVHLLHGHGLHNRRLLFLAHGFV